MSGLSERGSHEEEVPHDRSIIVETHPIGNPEPKKEEEVSQVRKLSKEIIDNAIFGIQTPIRSIDELPREQVESMRQPPRYASPFNKDASVGSLDELKKPAFNKLFDNQSVKFRLRVTV